MRPQSSTKYVALIRGVGPANPSQSNKNLKNVCEELGYRDVETVISSGNVIFETDSNDKDALGRELENAWREELGFESTTIVRSQQDLKRLVELKPFGNASTVPRHTFSPRSPNHP